MAGHCRSGKRNGRRALKTMVMENNADTGHGLLYKEFSVVFMQMFPIGTDMMFDKEKAEATGLLVPKVRTVDRMMFMLDRRNGDMLHRYKIKGFDFVITDPEQDSIRLWGKAKVEALVLFGFAVSITYRFVFDGSKCHLSSPVGTDTLIDLLSLHLDADVVAGRIGEEEETDANPFMLRFEAHGIPVDRDGAPVRGDSREDGPESEVKDFSAVCGRYRNLIGQHCVSPAVRDSKKKKVSPLQDQSKDLHYAFVNVWGDLIHPLADGSDLFDPGRDDAMTNSQVTGHILDSHRLELMGLMSLYPGEWLHRSLHSFEDFCGKNLAVDSDELIFVNSNVCIDIAAYNRNSTSPLVDWKVPRSFFKEYDVDCPEFFVILESVLIKKYLTDCMKTELIASTADLSQKSVPDKIADNAELSMKLSRIVLQLENSRFITHKVMFDRVAERVELEKNMDSLVRMMDVLDNSFHNLSDYRSIRSDFILNFILALISIASTFEILFQDIDMPFLEYVGLHSSTSAAILVWFVAAVTCFGILLVVSNALKNAFRSSRRK